MRVTCGDHGFSLPEITADTRAKPLSYVKGTSINFGGQGNAVPLPVGQPFSKITLTGSFPGGGDEVWPTPNGW